VLLDDGQSRRELTLNQPYMGVYMPAMIWGTQYRYSDDAVLLVFASELYDPNDYIRSYSEFRMTLTLPCFPELLDEEVDRIVALVNTWR
jgi:dTDP-4-amino-4,6-dideoxygalactose transaminase